MFPVVADPIYCGNTVNSVKWINRNGVWSASVSPTWCGRYSTRELWQNWEEVVSKTPSSSQWNKQWNTNQYWSMYNQFACHWLDWRAFVFKGDWNLEPSRRDVGLEATRRADCNP